MAEKNLKEFCHVTVREEMVTWDDSCLTIKEQAELITLNRTGLYRKSKEPSLRNLRLRLST